ncbi:inactive ubiquitin carboxyl-terminal hydrolase MINDY-4B [Centroberyx affinis]|uniref:inactive ubiquitin carboxyl-terminal hydrolase MINDY-4B n=1 Tax=Centroberyx affinis TaxID=166261 RepID=UPI003A5BBBA6
MSDCRLGYIELLQQEINKNPDRLCGGQEEEPDEALAPPPCSSLPSLCSIPRTLAVSPSLGGEPLTQDLSVNLRKILFGGTFHVFNYEWRKSCFKFREPNSELAYALETERAGARAVQMVVQARIIKFLLFSRQSGSEGRTLQSLCDVGQRDQERALAAALTDSLWLAGEERSATVTLVTADYCITPHLDYKLDDFTERLQLFTFNNKEDVRKFIYEHIQCFKEEGSHGVILFLYSLICSRTVNRLREDLDCSTSHLLQVRLGNFVCRQALLNLLLTGRASPNVFNGTVQCGADGRPLERPLQGVLARSDVGYLHWSREQMERDRLPQVGSMLKTPRFPIWLCSINSSCSVLFGPTRSLLSDWKMEHLFQLFFYNGQPTQKATARLTIDTHSHHWEASSSHSAGDPEKRFPSVEMTIRTKWDGAAIDWNGCSPFY